MFYDLPPAAAEPLLLRPDALYDPGSDCRMNDTVIVLENGRISRLLPAQECPDGKCLALPGMTAIPGLIDAHVHLCLRGEDGEMAGLGQRSEQEMDGILRENLQRNLLKGVTTVRDLGCPGGVMEQLRRLQPPQAPRVVASGPALTVPNGHAFFFGIPLEGEASPAAALDTLDQLGADVVKVMATGGNSTPGTNMDACQFSYEMFAQIVRMAHDREKKVACHAHGLAGVWQCIRAGADSIEHGSYMDDAAEDAMARSQIFYIATVCPGKLLRELPAAAQDRVSRRHRLIRRGADTGVRFGAGTDAGIPGVPHGSLTAEVQELSRLGLGPRRALRAATAENAALLGLPACGSILPGCAADIAVYAGDVTQDLALLDRPAMVIRAGHCIKNEK